MSLIAADAKGGSLLDRGVASVARQVFRGSTYTPESDRFGPYRLTRLLGEGGMGVVYLAERDDLGTVAAVKIMRDAWLSPSRRERFAAEQRTLAQLNHPLIARLFDADTLADGTPWFVMEYIEGVPLTTYCADHSASLTRRLELFRSVCEAVQHAHQHLIIHRDLKPTNILVTQDGGVKLVDFGIAKQLDSLEGGDQTRTGHRLMTPAYAAPEQLRGGRIGIHTDVYSLGVILYELLSGTLPFDPGNRSTDDLATAIDERPPERPSVLVRQHRLWPGGDGTAPSMSEWGDLDVLCLTAMHQDPKRRYATVDLLIRDIDHFLASRAAGGASRHGPIPARQVRAAESRGGRRDGDRADTRRRARHVLYGATRASAQRGDHRSGASEAHSAIHGRLVRGRRSSRRAVGQSARGEPRRPRRPRCANARRRAGGAGGSLPDARRHLSEARQVRARRLAHQPGTGAKARAVRPAQSRSGVGAGRPRAAPRCTGAVSRCRASRPRSAGCDDSDTTVRSPRRRKGQRGAWPRAAGARRVRRRRFQCSTRSCASTKPRTLARRTSARA